MVAVPLRQLGDMLGEFTCARVTIAPGARTLVIRDGNKLALISQCAWNFNTTARARPLGRDAEHHLAEQRKENSHV